MFYNTNQTLGPWISMVSSLFWQSYVFIFLSQRRGKNVLSLSSTYKLAMWFSLMMPFLQGTYWQISQRTRVRKQNQMEAGGLKVCKVWTADDLGCQLKENAYTIYIQKKARDNPGPRKGFIKMRELEAEVLWWSHLSFHFSNCGEHAFLASVLAFYRVSHSIWVTARQSHLFKRS